MFSAEPNSQSANELAGLLADWLADWLAGGLAGWLAVLRQMLGYRRAQPRVNTGHSRTQVSERRRTQNAGERRTQVNAERRTQRNAERRRTQNTAERRIPERSRTQNAAERSRVQLCSCSAVFVFRPCSANLAQGHPTQATFIFLYISLHFRGGGRPSRIIRRPTRMALCVRLFFLEAVSDCVGLGQRPTCVRLPSPGKGFPSDCVRLGPAGSDRRLDFSFSLFSCSQSAPTAAALCYS